MYLDLTYKFFKTFLIIIRLQRDKVINVIGICAKYTLFSLDLMKIWIFR
jgi:hypothetical protein